MAPRRRRVTDIFRDCQVYLVERSRKLGQEAVFRKSSEPIKKFLNANGVENPATGALQYHFPSSIRNGDGKTYSGVELRKSQGKAYFELDEVKEFLSHGITLANLEYARVIRTKVVEYLDIDELYALFHEKVVTEAQLRSLMHYPEPTYALWPIEEEDIIDEE